MISTCLLGVAAVLANRPEAAHAAWAIGAIYALAAGAWKPCIVLSALYGAIAGAMMLMEGIDNTALMIVVLMLSYIAQKFVVLALLGAGFAKLASLQGLLAALQAMGMPNLFLIPCMVMLRFFPTIWEDASHLMESLRTRRIAATRSFAFRHPALTCELLVVPLLMRSVRISDVLAASALTRGLGSRTKPTILQPLAFKGKDVAVLCLAILACGVLMWLQFGPR